MTLGIKKDMLIIYTNFLKFPNKLISASPKVLSARFPLILWEAADASYYVKLKLKTKSTPQNADSN